jgi:putative aldouronate transport system substrate-binding protein
MKDTRSGRSVNKIWIPVLLTAILIVLTGCSSHAPSRDKSAGSEDLPGWQRDAEDEVTFDWYINYSWFATGWGENIVSKTITQETGVSINFITPMGNEKEKLDALIASDALPDIITLGWWEPEVSVLEDKAMVYALNELADEYDAYFWKVADDEVVNWYTKEDGNLYCYPNSTCTLQDIEENDNIGSNQTFLVRKDIYEAIGSPDMTTPEGFQEAVEAAVRMYPKIKGEDLIPVGAHAFTETGCVSFDQYLQNFLAIPFEKDGQYYDRYTDPEYMKWLKMFRELGEEGLLSDDIFIDQRTQMEEKLAKGRYFCMIYQRSDMMAQEKELYKNNPESIYIAVDGPRNSNGDDYVLPTSSINGWTVTFISKRCERPDRAIEFLAYLMSEQGQKITYLGVEGVTYDMVEGKAVMKKEVSKLLNTDREQYDKLYGADDAYWMLQNNVMQLEWYQNLEEPLRQLEEWTYPYSQYMGQYEYYFPTDSKLGFADMQIKKLWSETLPRLLLATSEDSFDDILEDFIKKRDELGYQEVMKACTLQMKQSKEKLGIK